MYNLCKEKKAKESRQRNYTLKYRVPHANYLNFLDKQVDGHLRSQGINEVIHSHETSQFASSCFLLEV